MKVYGVFQTQQQCAILFEYIPGATLENIVKSDVVTPQDICWYAQHIASALEMLHKAGYIHRDIKPANIMIPHNSFGTPVKLIDFGFAKYIG